MCSLPIWAQSNLSSDPHAGHANHNAHQMRFDANGMVMNSNATELPLNCTAIAADVEFTVYAGTRYAADYPERTFAYSQHDYRVPPCSRVTVTLINEDSVRHQWMLHGLPRYLYPEGMFHLEAAGGHQASGTFIVPADDATYLVHCDMTQHMEKGMKAQLIAGKGAGTLWSIPGVSENFIRPQHISVRTLALVGVGFVLALTLSAIMPARGKP
jgi:plastocyanin